MLLRVCVAWNHTKKQMIGFGLGALLLAVLAVEGQRNIAEIENIADQGAHYVWRRKNDMPTPLSDFGIASNGLGSAYLSGGCTATVLNANNVTECTAINAFRRYDADEDKYVTLAPFTIARLRHSSVFWLGTVYLFGGRDAQEVLQPQTEAYSVANNQWTSLPPSANVNTSDGCAFVLNNRLYYAGGYASDYRVDNSAAYFDPSTNSWVPVAAKMIHDRGDCFSGVIGNKAYIAGGWETGFEVPLDSIEVFDGTAFTLLPAKLVPGRGDAAVCPIHAKLFMFGGEDIDRKPRDEVQVLSNGVISYAGELPNKRLRLHCASLTSSSIHVFGGQDESSDSMSERVDEFRSIRIFEDLEQRLQTPLRIVGTANTQRWMITLGGLLEMRARAPVRVSYRAVDSLRAQTEFMGTAANDYLPVDNLYVADVPLSTAKYNQLKGLGHIVVQIPVALTPLGVYANLDLTSGEKIVLDACQLVRIFNPNSKLKWSQFTSIGRFQDVDVLPLRMSDESSMTVTMMAYLAKECPTQYVASSFLSVAVSPSKSPPNSATGQITFSYQTHLLRTGEVFHEVYLRNSAGSELRTSDCTVDVYSPPSDFSADMSQVQIVRTDQATSWPVSSVTFAMLRADQTGEAQTGQLLVTFLNSLFAVQDEPVGTSLGLKYLPLEWNAKSVATVQSVIQLASGSTPYEVHLSGDVVPESDYSFAMTRRDRVDLDLVELSGQMGSVRSQVLGLQAADAEDAAFGIAVAGLVFALLAFVLAVYAACKVRKLSQLVARAGSGGGDGLGGGATASSRKSYQEDGVMNV